MDIAKDVFSFFVLQKKKNEKRTLIVTVVAGAVRQRRTVI
jgi:hypothetical protein